MILLLNLTVDPGNFVPSVYTIDKQLASPDKYKFCVIFFRNYFESTKIDKEYISSYIIIQNLLDFFFPQGMGHR